MSDAESDRRDRDYLVLMVAGVVAWMVLLSWLQFRDLPDVRCGPVTPDGQVCETVPRD